MTELNRRHSIRLGVLALGAAWLGSAWANRLPTAVSLPAALQQAQARKQPLVVMVSLDGCPFCKVVRENYLLPLVRERGLPVLQIDMRSSASLIDAQGKTLTHDQQVRAWGIRLAPTVLFLGAGGRELVARLDGAYLPDFYNAYLEERLLQATQLLAAAA